MKIDLPENLLDRNPIEIDTAAVEEALYNKCVLITGAAGSIGSEIVRQVAQFRPQLLLLCDISESPLHHLTLELQSNFPQLQFIPFVCDVRNETRMNMIFSQHHPQYVYHAAAYKHVPLMEAHPSESVLTNVWGTKILADLSVRHGVEVFVMISTDKAVNPCSIMGTCKRIAEIYVQSLDAQLHAENKGIRFITTRFGNVLGSNGSVVLHFEEQIAKGGPVTVTHPEIERYFMTIQEACQLVLEAGTLGNGGEIFIFDMGEPVKIIALAEKMIRFAGKEPYRDINIEFTGLRPGEKLYEELLTNDEHFISTRNKRIMTGIVDEHEYRNHSVIKSKIDVLIETAQYYQEKQVVEHIKGLVPEYITHQ